MKGPAGYGRYDDDPGYVGCPRARFSTSPCIARDGWLALSSGSRPVCVGCGNTPEYLAGELARDYEPARELMTGTDPVTLAGEFAAMVREATEPGEEAR